MSRVEVVVWVLAWLGWCLLLVEVHERRRARRPVHEVLAGLPRPVRSAEPVPAGGYFDGLPYGSPPT